MKSPNPYAIIPVWYLFLSALVFDQMLHCPKQGQRKWWTPLFLTFAILSLTSTTNYFRFSPALTSLWTQAVTLYVLHVLSLLFIECWPKPRFHQGLSSVDSKFVVYEGAQYLKHRARATYRLWGNPQMHCVFNDTAHQEKLTVPNKRSTQSKPTFLFLRAIKLPIYYYIYYHVMPILFKEIFISISPDDVGPNQQILLRRLHEVTVRETLLRAYHAVFWIWESVVFLDGANAVLAIGSVLVGLDGPDDWPTLFNSIGAATSLQRFWGRFWHRLATRPYTNIGRALASWRFGLQPGTVSYNTVVALVVFGLSGITHAITAWQCGLQDWYLEIGWFLLNFFGCSVERSFLMSIRAMAKQMGCGQELREIEESWLGRFVGYTWVFAFFFWGVPKWKYPRLKQEALAYERLWNFIAKLEGF